MRYAVIKRGSLESPDLYYARVPDASGSQDNTQKPAEGRLVNEILRTRRIQTPNSAKSALKSQYVTILP